MSDVPKSDRYAFLGREFLTWLWYAAESGNGMVAIEADVEVRVDFARRLVLETGGGVREGSTVQADAPSLAEESRTALRTGKKVAAARLVLDIDGRTFEVGLNADTFALSGVKVPSVLADGDGDRIDERLGLLDEVETLLDGLYIRFIRLRVSDQWPESRTAIRDWILASQGDQG